MPKLQPYNLAFIESLCCSWIVYKSSSLSISIINYQLLILQLQQKAIKSEMFFSTPLQREA